MSPVLLYLLAGFFLGNVTGAWHPLTTFGKKPPTQQLTELQAKLDAQQTLAVQAAKEAEAAKVAERAKLEQQIRSAQQDNLGIVTALKKVDAGHLSPEVRLAQRMALRVDFKLAAAIGRLPEADQEAMVDLIAQALSDKQAEVDAANAKLALMDSDFKAVTAQREELKVQIPKLQERAVKAESEAVATQAKVTAKTEEVKSWADKTEKALLENGSLWGSIKRAALLLGGIYILIVWILPGLIKHMGDGWGKTTLRHISGYLSAPLLYHDAKTKLDELSNLQPPTT